MSMTKPITAIRWDVVEAVRRLNAMNEYDLAVELTGGHGKVQAARAMAELRMVFRYLLWLPHEPKPEPKAA